jgi:hypothetical protein
MLRLVVNFVVQRSRLAAQRRLSKSFLFGVIAEPSATLPPSPQPQCRTTVRPSPG